MTLSYACVLIIHALPLFSEPRFEWHWTDGSGRPFTEASCWVWGREEARAARSLTGDDGAIINVRVECVPDPTMTDEAIMGEREL